MKIIEKIKYKKKYLALIIRNSYRKKKGINFFTPSKFSQQIAFMNYKNKHFIKPHLHIPRLKKIYDTPEVLFILKGSLRIDFYNKYKKYLFSKIAKKNDIVLLISNGHGFKIKKNCEMIEIKQGPYIKSKDKTRFDSINEKKIKIKK